MIEGFRVNMLMMRREVTQPRSRTAQVSLRLQIFLVLLLAIMLPAAIRNPNSAADWLRIVEIRNSMIAAAIASLCGVVCLRKVTAFPGVRAFGYILPCFAISYGMVIVGFLGARFLYSSIYLAISFFMAVMMVFVTSYWNERAGALRFYVVPHGSLDLVREVKSAEWIILDEPKVPSDPNSVIVADLRFEHSPEWERMLAESAVSGLTVYHTKQLRESLTGRVSMEHLSENSFGSLIPNLAYRSIKRLLDIGSSALLIVVLAPVMLILALAIRLDSKGPALFRQERMGYRGNTFQMIKFRTMHPRTDSSAQDARSDAMTQDCDPRITRIGRILRRTRLDELPQLFNVLRGQMSLIGPRPEAVALSRWYEAELPFYFYRHIVRPGMSGWAQVQQGHVTDLDAVTEKLAYDFYYIKNFSAWLDILIAGRTLAVMASGFGSK